MEFCISETEKGGSSLHFDRYQQSPFPFSHLLALPNKLVMHSFTYPNSHSFGYREVHAFTFNLKPKACKSYSEMHKWGNSVVLGCITTLTYKCRYLSHVNMNVPSPQ